MTFLILDGERYALQTGETTLGGVDDELLRDSPLGALPPFAVIDGMRIRAISAALPVRVNGGAIGVAAHQLRHGDVVSVGALTFHVGELDKAGRTDNQAGVTDADLARRADLASADPTAPTGGVLTSRRDGRRHAIGESGLTMGRDPDCDVVITTRSVSRRHARIVPGLLGYSLIDEGANRVLVNGHHVDATYLLSQGDVLQMGDEQFHFSADAATYEPDAALFGAPSVPLRPIALPSRPAQPVTDIAPPAARPVDAGALLATLQVLEGNVPAGTLYRVERPVVQMGRGAQNDVRLTDDSVSGAHATLLQRGGSWHLLDLGSRNGTYVEGQRVNECALTGACEVRLGAVALLFRPIASAAAERIGTLGVFGVTDAQPGRR